MQLTLLHAGGGRDPDHPDRSGRGSGLEAESRVDLVGVPRREQGPADAQLRRQLRRPRPPAAPSPRPRWSRSTYTSQSQAKLAWSVTTRAYATCWPSVGEGAEVQRVRGRRADGLAGAPEGPVGIGAEPVVDEVEVHVGEVGADLVVGHAGDPPVDRRWTGLRTVRAVDHGGMGDVEFELAAHGPGRRSARSSPVSPTWRATTRGARQGQHPARRPADVVRPAGRRHDLRGLDAFGNDAGRDRRASSRPTARLPLVGPRARPGATRMEGWPGYTLEAVGERETLVRHHARLQDQRHLRARRPRS